MTGFANLWKSGKLMCCALCKLSCGNVCNIAPTPSMMEVPTFVRGNSRLWCFKVVLFCMDENP